MRRLLIAVVFLILLFSASLWNLSYLSECAGEISELLRMSHACSERGDWDLATEHTEQAMALWEEHSPYFYVVLIHSEADNIYIGFYEVLELIKYREMGEYFAANARLMAQLNLLIEMERFSLQNIL